MKGKNKKDAENQHETKDREKCFLRFENNRSAGNIHIHWVSYEGKELLYKSLQPGGGSYVQTTYATHTWRVKTDLNDTLKDYTGPSATINFTDSDITIIPGITKPSLEARAHPTDPTVGLFRQRDSALGVPITAYDCVTDEAIEAAKATVQHMLQDVRPVVVKRMVDLGAQVAIIGAKQTTTDIPEHYHLKGTRCEDGRDYDQGTRGLGGNIAHPTMSVGEENVLLNDSNNYPSESLLVHEFAHSVMNLGFYGQPEIKAIELAYQDAKRQGLYHTAAYVSANSEEYFAECSQAWFDATIRTDATDGVITREQLKKRDPLMATIMVAVWGDGDWRYPQIAPATLKHKPHARKAVEAPGSTEKRASKKKKNGILSVFSRSPRRSKRNSGVDSSK